MAGYTWHHTIREPPLVVNDKQGRQAVAKARFKLDAGTWVPLGPHP